MIEYAIRDSAAEAIQAGVTPQSGDCDALWGHHLARTIGRLDGAAPVGAGKRPDLNSAVTPMRRYRATARFRADVAWLEQAGRVSPRRRL